mmetsp:Transcript_3247/g.5822  ORF Transcript_3247/g.5822 Transcript_3247/m.5822 type:complete len:270 (-) Transcript_3247:865-1674(-)
MVRVLFLLAAMFRVIHLFQRQCLERIIMLLQHWIARKLILHFAIRHITISCRHQPINQILALIHQDCVLRVVHRLTSFHILLALHLHFTNIIRKRQENHLHTVRHPFSLFLRDQRHKSWSAVLACNISTHRKLLQTSHGLHQCVECDGRANTTRLVGIYELRRFHLIVGFEARQWFESHQRQRWRTKRLELIHLGAGEIYAMLARTILVVCAHLLLEIFDFGTSRGTHPIRRRRQRLICARIEPDWRLLRSSAEHTEELDRHAPISANL